MKYQNINRMAGSWPYPASRVVRPAIPARPRVVLLFWLALAIVPWLVIAAVLMLGD